MLQYPDLKALSQELRDHVGLHRRQREHGARLPKSMQQKHAACTPNGQPVPLVLPEHGRALAFIAKHGAVVPQAQRETVGVAAVVRLTFAAATAHSQVVRSRGDTVLAHDHNITFTTVIDGQSSRVVRRAEVEQVRLQCVAQKVHGVGRQGLLAGAQVAVVQEQWRLGQQLCFVNAKPPMGPGLRTGLRPRWRPTRQPFAPTWGLDTGC